MSDSLPENSFSGILRVVKLTTGEEIIGLVSEASPDKILIKLPAKLDAYMSRDETGNMVEYVKLTNFIANIEGYEISLPRTVIIYIGKPAIELEKMYEVYFMTMQTDPKSVVSSGPEEILGPEAGLQLLNDLFNNEDFVDFVNELIDNFENAEILIEDDSEDMGQEGVIEDEEVLEPQIPPKRKKRDRMKPEKKILPYNPEGDPNKAESWPDDPSEYFN
jgi:hypothetical protein